MACCRVHGCLAEEGIAGPSPSGSDLVRVDDDHDSPDIESLPAAARGARACR